MNRPLLKKTFTRTLKWYPLVIIAMLIMGIIFAKLMDDSTLAIGLALMGAILGPTLEAIFYYQGELKKERQAMNSSALEPASRLSFTGGA